MLRERNARIDIRKKVFKLMVILVVRMGENTQKGLIVFQGKAIRRTWFNDEWWFSVVDIIVALTQTDRARKYWSDLKLKLAEENFEVSEKIGQLKLMAEDGKLRFNGFAKVN